MRFKTEPQSLIFPRDNTRRSTQTKPPAPCVPPSFGRIQIRHVDSTRHWYFVFYTKFNHPCSQEWMPYTEVTAAMLERAFEAGIFGVNIPLSDDGNRYAVLNPNGTGTHHPCVS